MTNADKIKADIRDMSIEQLATLMFSCPDSEEYRGPCPNRDSNCIDCKKEWLSKEVAELKEEPKKQRVPNLIDRLNFERQLESYSIKAFVHQFKHLACKINEIITYLKEAEDGQTDRR